MTLEIAVATLVAIGYALGAYADEKRDREKLVRRRLACPPVGDQCRNLGGAIASERLQQRSQRTRIEIEQRAQGRFADRRRTLAVDGDGRQPVDHVGAFCTPEVRRKRRDRGPNDFVVAVVDRREGRFQTLCVGNRLEDPECGSPCASRRVTIDDDRRQRARRARADHREARDRRFAHHRAW